MYNIQLGDDEQIVRRGYRTGNLEWSGRGVGI